MRSILLPASLILAACLAGGGCDAVQSLAGVENVAAGDPRIAGLWRAARRFDRARYGFTPLPETGEVKWESAPGHGYDAMLHTWTPDPYTSRTIAFRRAGKGWRWIGEQQIFEGPHEYDSVDGRQREQISISFEIEPVSGAPLKQVSIRYLGEDKRFEQGAFADLTLAQARAILAEWGYR